MTGLSIRVKIGTQSVLIQDSRCRDLWHIYPLRSEL